MGILEDVIKALERIPAWKRVSTVPDELAALRKRVEALELRLAVASGDKCPRCRVMAYSLSESRPEPPPWGESGAMEDVYRCASCHYENVVKRQ